MTSLRHRRRRWARYGTTPAPIERCGRHAAPLAASRADQPVLLAGAGRDGAPSRRLRRARVHPGLFDRAASGGAWRASRGLREPVFLAPAEMPERIRRQPGADAARHEPGAGEFYRRAARSAARSRAARLCARGGARLGLGAAARRQELRVARIRLGVRGAARTSRADCRPICARPALLSPKQIPFAFPARRTRYSGDGDPLQIDTGGDGALAALSDGGVAGTRSPLLAGYRRQGGDRLRAGLAPRAGAAREPPQPQADRLAGRRSRSYFARSRPCRADCRSCALSTPT